MDDLVQVADQVKRLALSLEEGIYAEAAREDRFGKSMDPEVFSFYEKRVQSLDIQLLGVVSGIVYTGDSHSLGVATIALQHIVDPLGASR